MHSAHKNICIFVKYCMPKLFTSKRIKQDVSFIFIDKFPKFNRKLAFQSHFNRATVHLYTVTALTECHQKLLQDWIMCSISVCIYGDLNFSASSCDGEGLDSWVSIYNATDWAPRVSWFDSWHRRKIYIFPRESLPALESIQSPIQWLPTELSLGVEGPERESYHSRQFITEVRNLCI